MNNQFENMEFLRKAIFLGGEEPLYGEDAAYVDYPVAFPTVNLYLSATTELIKIVDAMREERGFLPMLPTEKHKDDYDMEGWYDFYIGLNGYSVDHVDNAIEAIVCNSDSEDNEEMYAIELSDKARFCLAIRLNEEIKRNYDMSLMDMLHEAEVYMES